MRKILDSGKCSCRVWLSARADARSCPKGFSTTTRAPGVLDDHREHARRNGQVIQWPLRRPECLAQRLESGALVVVAIHIAQQASESRHHRLVRARHERFETLAHACDQPADITPLAGNADHRRSKDSPANQVIQRREDLPVTQVPGGAEQHDGIAITTFHVVLDVSTRHLILGARVCQEDFSTWPPKPKRIADSTLFAKSAWPRDSKRPYRAALSTGAGTPTSMAASTVQRPSPESATWPAKPASLPS